MGFVFRFLAMVALALGVILAVIDASRSVATNAVTLTPVLDALGMAGADPAAPLFAFGSVNGIDWFWTPAVTAFLGAPAILVLAGLALIFYALGYRRRRPTRLALQA